MSIPELRFDNPLDVSQLPDEQLLTKLPALGRPQPLGNLYTWANAQSAVVAVVLLQCVLTFFSGYAGASTWVLSGPLALLFAGAIVARVRFPYPVYTWIVILVAAPTLAANVSMAVHRVPSGELRLTIVWAELIVCLLMEIGIHHFYLAKNGITGKGKRADRFDQLTGEMLNYGFAVLVAFVFIAIFLGALAALWATTIMAIAAASLRHARLNLKVWKDFREAAISFLFYPSAATIGPGNVISPTGNMIARVILVGLAWAAGMSLAVSAGVARDYFTAAAWGLLPPLLCIALFYLVYSTAGEVIRLGAPEGTWSSIVESMRESPNPVERNGIFLGYVAADGSPVVVDRELLFQHSHVLGATGTNKSSMGLAPYIEQIISFPDTSVVIIDLKADTPELYHAANSAMQRYRSDTTKFGELKMFSLENDTGTHVFNPFLTQGWTNLSLLARCDVLCTACGLAYGNDYGRSFFTSSNSAVVREANLANPDAMSFRQLFSDVARLLTENSDTLLPEVRKAGVHSMEVIGRMAAFNSLNVVPGNGYPDAALDAQIQLADFFQRPNVAFFRLPSTTASIGAPAIARLVLFFLIIAGKTAERKIKIHIVCDEFQRMASESLDQIMQLARSHDCSLTLANQSLSDLQASSSRIYQAVSGSCAIRQWFSVSSLSDIESLQKQMGTHEEVQVTTTHSSKGTNTSYKVDHVPRARITDLHTISEHPNLSVLQVGGSGRAYARYRGIPFICYSNYHISKTEFERRKKLGWPNDLPGMIKAKEEVQIVSFKSPSNKKPKRGRKPDLDNDNPPEQRGNRWDPGLFE